MIIDLKRSWLKKARCAGMDVNDFFIDHAVQIQHPSPRLRQAWEKAKEVCHQCPVMRECARDNLGETEGIWGGLDPIQRKELRAKHTQRVRQLTGPLKIEYAKLAYDLHHQRQVPLAELGRFLGMGRGGGTYLYQWYEAYLKEQDGVPEVKAALKAASGLTVENVSRAYGTTHHQGDLAPAG